MEKFTGTQVGQFGVAVAVAVVDVTVGPVGLLSLHDGIVPAKTRNEATNNDTADPPLMIFFINRPIQVI
jgi:hypothetical protein